MDPQTESFPGSEQLDMEQRTDEWFDARRGRLTASRVGAWLLGKDKRSRNAWDGAIAEVAASAVGLPEAPVFENWAMQRGTAMEEQAVARFEKDTGLVVSSVGFCQSHKHAHIGCSPDGLIYSDNVGFEGKVPVPKKHCEYLLPELMPERKSGLKTLLDDYCWQVRFSIACTGARGWWLQGFNPGIRPVLTFVERDQQCDDIAEALGRFNADVETFLQRAKEDAAA